MRRIPLLPTVFLAAACTGKPEESEPAPFSLGFTAVSGGTAVDCATPATGLGPEGADAVGLSDLRFFISDLVFFDEADAAVPTTLDENDFQYQGASGQVSLVDLTGSADGTCADGSISFSEGTARTNDHITGSTLVDQVHGISFAVGVPQALMQEVIGSTSAEAAPSPLNELFWSWATGYRHFVFNFTVDDGSSTGEGYAHVGSTDCAADGELALEGRDSCGFVNTAEVHLHDFDLAAHTITVDIAALLDGLDLVSPIYDPTTFEVIGEGPGVECHSSPSQDDCAPMFANLGIDIATGAADHDGNAVFGAR